MTSQPPAASMPVRGTEGYGDAAAVLADQYESVTFADVHRDILHLLPSAPGRALDIGAGTGRDAAALAAKGHRVLAVEPTAELRRYGQRLHPSTLIEWIDDSLPELPHVAARAGRFDLVFLTAVWMHLDPAERRRAMARIAPLVAPDGLVIMSLRRGPIPAGRRMYHVPTDEVIAQAKEERLSVAYSGDREDMLGRDDVTWTFLAFRR